MALLVNVDDTIKTACLFFSLFFWLVLCNVPLRDQLYWRSSLPNDQFLRLYGLTISDCIHECKLRPGCSSVNYKTLFGRCEINDINSVLGRIKHPGSIFAVRTEWKEDLSALCEPACSTGETCNTNTNLCEIKECGPPPAVVYTVVNGNRRSVGSNVQYKCTTDAVTAFTSVCLDTGTWSSVPACPIVDCGPPPTVPLSSLIPGGSTFEGHSRQYQCNAGYGPDPTTDVSTMMITCQESGDWTASNFQCIISCGEPSPKPNAHVLSVGTTFGSTRQYTCNGGHVLSEASDPHTMTVTCLASGAWTATNFQCVADCLTPSTITGVTISSGSTIYQSTRTLQCLSGYQAENIAVPTSTITCLQSGDWSTPDNAFKCLKECTSAPTSKPNSRISPTQSYGVTHVVGDILTYQCLDGYSPATGSDSGEVTCQSDGSWSDSSIVCVVDCGAPPTVTNSAWSGTTIEGSVVTYTCSNQYELSPTGVDSTVTCQASGTWTGVLFTCEIVTLGNDCATDSDCLEANSRCVDNNYNGRKKCLCDYHTEYDEASKSCTTRCNSYSETFTKVDNTYIFKFNLGIFWDINKNNCKQRCIDYGQNCASVDYWRGVRKCYLNKVTYQHVFDGDPSQLVQDNEFEIYTRDCSMG